MQEPPPQNRETRSRTGGRRRTIAPRGSLLRGELHTRPRFGAAVRRRFGRRVLDLATQIGLFGKLKLTHCARPELRVGVFQASGDDGRDSSGRSRTLRQAAASRQAASNSWSGCDFIASGLYFQCGRGRRLKRSLGQIASERFERFHEVETHELRPAAALRRACFSLVISNRPLRRGIESRR
jgi:hypothetical protein